MVISLSCNCIILLLTHNDSNLFLRLGMRVKNVVKKFVGVYLLSIISGFETWIDVEDFLPMVTGKYGTYVRYYSTFFLPW